ncbi:uncharacterized protein LOC108047975 isoform X3 [Drosophila rhopaloa]|uniref:E3 ubiquitin-protein ligase n=1 Tax=Drosophila rhopaloa TaxID=1041015 RepID=A0ABM5J536_DRORH|nr:uncharacterized protein LOC108047975 isoform X3 [Drosophila rhopaloa]XP_044313939.1 uncharacterized protein LOC108047975 isoform X3 [Drosophila rhopaloa]
MSQQRATDQGAATTSSNNNSDVITLGDVDEDGDVIFVGIVRPTVTTVDLCLSPSTSAAAAAAARSGNGSADEPDAEPGLGSRATASASNPILPASSPEDAAKPGTVDAATTISDGDSFSATAVALECPICLQTCIHPARLPCGHIFCFLCVKGVAYKNPRCAMCRREIPAEFLDHPQLVNGIEDICTTRATEDGYQWYYEGRNATTISDGDSFSATAVALECPICLQTCIHPARLPCGHIFCFLCVKGVAYKNPRCAMCRREIPAEFLDHPQLVNGIEDICTTRATEDGYQWYYEGRNGWWQYDDRTSQDIEEAFKKGDKSCTILVAGYVYIVDLEQLVQQRQNEPTRCRRVKRDLATIPKKGVAGLRIEGNQVTSDTIFSRPPTTANPTTVAAAASSFISTIAATDAAIRIASDIIGSTLAHADELTRGLAASNISDDPSSSSSSDSFSICTPPLLLTAKCVFVASLISTIYLTLY